MIDLRIGRWEDVLADVEQVDAVITDPPYSERTHASHNKGTRDVNAHGKIKRREIRYSPWSEEDVDAFVDSWSSRCRGWFCVLTSHHLIGRYQAAFERAGRYSFAPVPIVKIGGRVRLAGDGPCSWTVYLMASRPRNREFSSWGTLPGAYVTRGAIERLLVCGGKDLNQMLPIVRDYTRHGDLVCDPCAGGGTTLLAAAMEGRRAIGAEMDPETYEKAKSRLDEGYTPDMFAGVPEAVTGKQGALL